MQPLTEVPTMLVIKVAQHFSNNSKKQCFISNPSQINTSMKYNENELLERDSIYNISLNYYISLQLT